MPLQGSPLAPPLSPACRSYPSTAGCLSVKRSFLGPLSPCGRGIGWRGKKSSNDPTQPNAKCWRAPLCESGLLDDTHVAWYDIKKLKDVFLVPPFVNLFRRVPKPRCPSCHKWNRIYLTGGEFLSSCVHCGAPLTSRRPAALWGVLVVLGAGVLVLAAAIPLLSR